MRRIGLIAVTVVAALTQATTSANAASLTHVGSHVYSRTTPSPCFANVPKGLPNRLALGCNCPSGEVVPHAPTATYRFELRAGTRFKFQVVWGGAHKPRVTTSQAGPWSYVKVRGPRRCAVVIQIFRVSVARS
jgi:hypothetical protein